MILNIPLAVWLGILTIISVFITALFGIAVHVFHKNVFKYHKIFAFTSLTLALIHAILAMILWFYRIVI
ncbi:hypothetical protein J4429_02455 [Candidatus Pacearchaeota archaeon]|nr:hypothetical protein [Candidatus Pacearchaeota archaeon]